MLVNFSDWLGLLIIRLACDEVILRVRADPEYSTSRVPGIRVRFLSFCTEFRFLNPEL